MITPNDIPGRLKRLRERSGLSVRAMAQRVGMSASGYGHYENAERFKDSVLPVPQARIFADALRGTSVDPSEVMELTGLQTAQASGHEHIAQTGFADAATHFTFAEQPVPMGSHQPALHAIFGSAATTPDTYRLSIALPAFGLLAGDVLLIDSARLPAPGDLAIVSFFDEEHATSTSGVYRYLPPYLLEGTIPERADLLRVDNQSVTVRHPVVGSIRGMPI